LLTNISKGNVRAMSAGGDPIDAKAGHAEARNHGLLNCGHSVGEAAWWFINLERSCQAQLIAMAAGIDRHARRPQSSD
jgi:ribulose-5-phosphate 4-epimerase/fuculose-1-phosphate aldolase